MSIDWNQIDGFADEHDWESAFGESEWTTSCTPGDFGRDDVQEVLSVFCHDGESWNATSREECSTDGYYAQIEMYGAFRLKDGRFGYVQAGADTTGWGCQDWNTILVADSLEELVRNMCDEARVLLGYADGIGSNVVPHLSPEHP